MSNSDPKWFADLVRASFFVEPSAGLRGDDFWGAAAGAQAESDETRPREAVRKQSGTVPEGRLDVVITPARIDLLLHAEVQGNLEGMPNLGSVGEALAAVSGYANKVGPILERCPRLGLNANASIKKASKAEAFSHLNRLFPCMGLDSPDADDFFLQINRKRASSSVRDLVLNRIARYSCVKLQRFNINPFSGPKTPPGPIDVQEEFLVRIEMDFNTALTPVKFFSADDCKALLAELSSDIEATTTEAA